MPTGNFSQLGPVCALFRRTLGCFSRRTRRLQGHFCSSPLSTWSSRSDRIEDGGLCRLDQENPGYGDSVQGKICLFEDLYL